MSYKGKQAGEWVNAVKAIRGILNRHPEERVLIHAVSYALARHLTESLQGARAILSYANAQERTETLALFRQTPNAVLIGPLPTSWIASS
jgi:Rad3-related DNA helicase